MQWLKRWFSLLIWGNTSGWPTRRITSDENIELIPVYVCIIIIGLPLYFYLSFFIALGIHLMLAVWYLCYLHYVGGTLIEVAVFGLMLSIIISILGSAVVHHNQKAHQKSRQHYERQLPVTKAQPPVV